MTFTGKVEMVTFEQSSSQIVNKGHQNLEINCKHDDSSLITMLWYQHRQSSHAMSLIGYSVHMSEPVYEDQFQGTFSMKRGDTLKGSLIINAASSSDSAVYYCAASTQ